MYYCLKPMSPYHLYSKSIKNEIFLLPLPTSENPTGLCHQTSEELPASAVHEPSQVGFLASWDFSLLDKQSVYSSRKQMLKYKTCVLKLAQLFFQLKTFRKRVFKINCQISILPILFLLKMSKLVKIYYQIITLLAYESSFCNF